MPDPEILEQEKTQAELEAEQEAVKAAATVADEKAAASAAAGELEGKTPEDQAAETEEKRKGGVQRRINELTRDRAIAKAEAEYWRTKALEPATGVVKPVLGEAKPKPQAADFETTEAYLDARDAWVKDETKRETFAEMEKRSKAESEKSEQGKQAQAWQEKEVATQQKHPDYDEVSARALETFRELNTPASHAIAQVLQDPEIDGPGFLQFFGEHPEELEALAKLGRTAAVVALGEIKGRLAGEKPADNPLPAQTRAPKPPTPVKKGAPTATPRPDEPESDKALSDEEWLKARTAQLRSR